MAFKKGDQVFCISTWDNKGTFVVSQYKVGSWGAKQGFLIHQDGTNRRRRIYADMVNRTDTLAWEHVYHVGSVDPTAKALELAAAYIAQERARLEAILARKDAAYQDEGYRNCIRKELAALHEPRAIGRDGA